MKNTRNRKLARSHLFCCALLLILAAPVHAGKDPARAYAWRLPVLGQPEARQCYRLTLPGVVYDRALQFPNDLRVMDGAGTLWPHILLPEDRGQIRLLSVEERNRSVASEGEAFHRLDLWITEKGDARHDRVIISSSGTRFVRMAEVYGAENRGDWVLLGKGYLIRDQRPHLVHQETIVYPTADFPRLQVRVYPNARDAGETFNVTSVRVQGFVRAAPPMELLATTPVVPGAAEANENAEVLVVDLGYRNRPFDRVRFTVDRTDYVRTVSVCGRNDAGEAWSYLGCGDIQALDGCRRDHVDVAGRCRYVKCEVMYYDDQPLGLAGFEVLAAPDVLLLEAGQGADPYLYVGDAFAGAPRYDLARRYGRIDAATCPVLGLGEIGENPTHRLGGFGKLGPWLAGVAVGAVSLLVVYVIVAMLKQVK